MSIDREDTGAPTSSAAWNTVLPTPSSSDTGSPLAWGTRQRPVTSSPPDPSGYDLVDRPEPPPVPDGWYAACAAGDLAAGDTLPFIAVGRELVAFRGHDGRASVLDAHCPHMGAHLGGGQVHGSTLQCPYHGWRFDGDGTCVEISYSPGRIPPRACVRSYPVLEQDELVLFWFHGAGAAPSYDVPPLRASIPADWSEPREFRGELVASLQDMAENNVDDTHFFFVHGRAALDESTSRFETDGPFSTVVETFDEGMVFTRHTYGPGVAVVDIPDLAVLVTTTTPIDRRHVRLLWHFYFPPGNVELADDIVEGVVGPHGLGADEPIWRDKVFRDRPLLVKGDGPIMEFRRWYEQFYEGSRPTDAPSSATSAPTSAPAQEHSP